MSYQEFFETTFGRKPRNYQSRLATELLERRNTVLVAPTGAGKTLAALAPFFYAKKMGRPIADRVIYALPLRSLASALHQSISDELKQIEDANITIQMGNQPEDPFFEGDVVFTTIDQMLSAYVGLPYSTSHSSANIPPGALLGALVIIDEFHLLSYGEALPTVLDMMDRLHPFTQFLVMTATVPEEQVKKIASHFKGVSFCLTDEEVKELPEKTRILHWNDENLDAQFVLDHLGNKTLVVVNTVKRAQALYLSLQKMVEQQGGDLEMRCLHSRLFPLERKQTEEWVLERFKQKNKQKSLLIATQVVEAGLDISADVLLTDLCPANALLQRMGRCARFANEQGTIYVCSVADENGRRNLPYKSQMVEKTETFLKQQQEVLIHEKWEHEFIEFVHKEIDAEKFRTAMILWKQEHSKAIDKAYVLGEANLSMLVRNVNSINVLVHDEPNSLRMELRPERVSVNTYTIEGFLRAHFKENQGDNESPIGWYLTFAEDQWNREVAVWKPILSERDWRGSSTICLSPQYVNYQTGVGLLLSSSEEGTSVLSQETLQMPARSGQRFDYFHETYMEHVTHIRELYQDEERRGAYQVANERLTHALELPVSANPAWLAECTGALHDIGKLTVKYQAALKAWQREVKGIDEQDWLAHSDFNGHDSEERAKQKLTIFKRPSHSVEGSIMALHIILQMVGQIEEEEMQQLVGKAITLAIMRHHSAFALQHEEFQFEKRAVVPVQESLTGLFDGEVELEVRSYYDGFHRDLIDQKLLALYWYLVRRLRLNDRRSQAQVAEMRTKGVNASHAI